MSVAKENQGLHVQSNISIITDGSRGVTLSQVISTSDPNLSPAAFAMGQNDKRHTGPAVSLPNVKMIKPIKSHHHRERNHNQLAIANHSHGAKSADHTKSNKSDSKVPMQKSSSRDGSDKRHGKPSAVKSRSSKKSSVRSSKSSSSSKYSEPNPIRPDAQAQDLAELLLEKLSGTSISSSKSDSTLRLSAIHESLDDNRSQTDKSFFSEVSKDGTKKFTVEDGRPLNRNEKPEVRVRFQSYQADKESQFPEKVRALTSAHAPLSTQLYVTKTYPAFEKQPQRAQTESNSNLQFASNAATAQQQRSTMKVETESNSNVQLSSNAATTARQRPPMDSGQNVKSSQHTLISQPSCKTQISQPSCKYYANITPTLSYDNKQTVTVHMSDKQQDNNRRTIRTSVGPFPQRNYYGYVPPANGPFLAANYFSENTTV